MTWNPMTNNQRMPWNTQSPFGGYGGMPGQLSGDPFPTQTAGVPSAAPRMGQALYQMAMQQGPPGTMAPMAPRGFGGATTLPFGGKLDPRGADPQGPQSIGDRLMGGLKGVGDYFTDPEQGLGRTYLATQAAGGLASMYGARQENKRYEEEKAMYEEERVRERELEEEERRRYDANAPARASLINRFTSRMGG